MTKQSNGKKLRFTHLLLENWRNFTHVDVDLQGRVFLVGPNASGKSNLLDAFRFLRDISSVGGGFQDAVRRRGGVKSLRCLAARRYPDVLIEVSLGNEENEKVWKYRLQFKQDQQRRIYIQNERVEKEGIEILNRPNKDDIQDKKRLSQTYLEQVYVNRDYRDIADFFNSVDYLHIVPQLVREPNRSVGISNDPFGGDFLQQIAKTQEKTKNARLRRITNALSMAVPQLEDLRLKRDTTGTPHLRGKYENWRSRGAWQTEERFSDGTLCLMGLLWAVLSGKGPLLLEEPELSLHPEAVRYIPQMFARIQRKLARQILISTHSPDLLRDKGIGLDEVFLLTPAPGTEGTSVKSASDYSEIKSLLENGETLADAVMPLTRPENVSQLPLFPDMK